ncbi:MAG: ABC transporter substrate-binding protein/permease [Bryobacteraceae bacterium]
MKTTSSRVLLVAATAAFLASCSGIKNTEIATLDDANRARIGVMTGATGETIAHKRFPEAQIKSFDDVMNAVAAIQSGQLDAIVTAYPTAFQVSKKNPALGFVAEALSKEDTSIGMRKNSGDLLPSVNQAIAELKSNGTLADMRKRWFKPELGPYDEPDIQLPTQGPPLRIGVSATREPFSFVDKSGRVTGHDGELARRIAAKLRRPITFSDMKFMALIPALQSGKVDLIITGMTGTAERKKFVDFSDPYFESSQVLLVRKTASKAAGGMALTAAQDIATKRIGVQLGSAHDTYAARAFPNATVLRFNSGNEMFLAVTAGKVDVALFDEVPLRERMREDDSLGILGDSLFSFSVGAGFPKSGNALRQQFNQFLAEIRKNGVYADMTKRWIETHNYTMPAIEGSRANGVLVVGTNIDGPPFGFLQENQPNGFDIELCRRFGAYIGKEVKFADMQFGGLIAAVSSGKVNMIASSIYITEERQKQIDFSDPYYDMGNRIAALKSNIAAYGNQGAGKAAPGFLDSIINSFESNIIQEKRYLLLWDGLKTTAVLSVLATALGTLLGALVCFLRMSRRKMLHVPAKFYISVLRGTPVLVLLMLIFYVVFASIDISPVLAATIAFGMNFAAYVAEIFRTGIEGVDNGQTEAGIAMGFTKTQTFLYIVLPQTARRILPVYKGEFISLVKMTSIVGYIAVQDLTKASDIIRSRTFDAFFPLIVVAILYFAISWLLMQALDYLERRTDPKYKREKAVQA